MYSKTISPRLSRAKPACVGYSRQNVIRADPCSIPDLGRSPPARAVADYFFKDHQLSLRTEKSLPHRGRFFGKPLRAISRLSHQDAQPLPSPLVGEGAGGRRGKGARKCRISLISPKNSTLERKPLRGSLRTDVPRAAPPRMVIETSHATRCRAVGAPARDANAAVRRCTRMRHDGIAS
jgi:hypothetical protein